MKSFLCVTLEQVVCKKPDRAQTRGGAVIFMVVTTYVVKPSCLRCDVAVTRESLAREIAERQHLDSVVDSTRSVVFDVNSSGKRREICVCARFWESVHEPSVAIRRKSDVQVHGRANGQSGSEMGPWNLGWQGANDRRLTDNVVQKARSLHRVPLEVRFVISELKKSARVSLERQGGELESDDCDATGPRFIWTSTCELDDKGRRLAWCNAWLQWRFRFGTAHKRVGCDWKRHWLTRERVQLQSERSRTDR